MIFSTVKQMLETVGRTRASTWADLDKLTCIWTGPTGLADKVKMGATHPQYGKMEVNAIRKIADVAGITKLELEYVGLFDGGDRGPIVQEESANESEVEFKEDGGQFVSVVTNKSTDADGNSIVTGFTYTFTFVTLNKVIHYLSFNKIWRYVAYKPNAPIGGGGEIDILSIRPAGATTTSFSETVASGSSSTFDFSQQLGPYGHHTENFCSSFQTQAISPNWYRVTEIWTAREFAG
jgi:hypothetical protein